jgi:MFS family permease
MLLRDNPGFRALWAARAVSFVGDGISTTALVLLAAERSGPGGVGLLLLANALPRCTGPLAGVLADRVETRRLLMSCDLASALVMAAVAVTVPPLPTLLALVAMTALLATIRGPAGRSAVPDLVAERDRAPANALLGLAFTAQLAVGPALGGLLAAGPGGTQTALAVDVGTFVASALLLTRLPRLPRGRGTGLWRSTGEGLRHVATHRRIRVLVITLFLVVTFAGLDNVALVFLTRDELRAGPLGFGLAASGFGVGMLLASAACSRLGCRSPVAVLLVGTAATGAGTLLTGVAPLLAVAVATQLVAGAGNATENIGYDTLVQDLVPRELLGRVFGAVGTAAQLGAALAYACGGPLVTLTGPRAVFVIGGAGTLAMLLVLAPALRHGQPDPHRR